MKKLLIIYPHWPPSNLAGVHRARLIANYLEEFNWQSTVLTVKEEYYEENLDQEFCQTVSNKIEVVKVDAYNVGKVRLIGDIGLRSFLQLRKKALELLKNDSYDFIWIPIPSFYSALIGPFLFNKTGVPYGIDYIDPWVRDIKNRKDIRTKLSLIVAKFLEPRAVKKASLITGVSYEYYRPVIERNMPTYLEGLRHQKDFVNPHTGIGFNEVDMPYGFDPNDHKISLKDIKYPWGNDEIPFLYAGAYLPNARVFMEEFMKSLVELKKQEILTDKHRFYFLGTGPYQGESIKELSIRYGVNKYVVEIRNRFRFLEILNFLNDAEGVLIIGSTEKHYTASKTFQSLMSRKRVFSIFHKESSAIQCLKDTLANQYSVEYLEDNNWRLDLPLKLTDFLNDAHEWNPNLKLLEETYSSKQSAKQLVQGIESVIN